MLSCLECSRDDNEIVRWIPLSTIRSYLQPYKAKSSVNWVNESISLGWANRRSVYSRATKSYLIPFGVLYAFPFVCVNDSALEDLWTTLQIWWVCLVKNVRPSLDRHWMFTFSRGFYLKPTFDVEFLIASAIVVAARRRVYVFNIFHYLIIFVILYEKNSVAVSRVSSSDGIIFNLMELRSVNSICFFSSSFFWCGICTPAN